MCSATARSDTSRGVEGDALGRHAGSLRGSAGVLQREVVISGAALRQLVAPHGWGNPAGRVGTFVSPALPLEGAGRVESEDNSAATRAELNVGEWGRRRQGNLAVQRVLMSGWEDPSRTAHFDRALNQVFTSRQATPQYDRKLLQVLEKVQKLVRHPIVPYRALPIIVVHSTGF